jgi:two-component system, NarL family, nitrate/nitrite response regulator NarL
LPLKIIVAHSNPVFRDIVSNILCWQNTFHVVAKAATAAELLQANTIHQPDIIVTDVALNGMEGFMLRRLAVACREVKVIISWQYHDEALMPAALSGGYAGYISHDASTVDYFTAIKEIMRGNVSHCYRTQKYMNLQATEGQPDAALREILKEKFLHLAYCIQLNFTNKEIAMCVALSKETVDTYRKILNKVLGSQSSAAIDNFIRKYERYKS